jgi:predicted phage terminase large subunit-like protein
MRFSETQVAASLCRESYEDFVKEFWDTVVAEPLTWNFHMSVLCGEIQAVLERVFRGLPKQGDEVFNVSPGTSKSLLASVFPTAWAWTRMPSFRSINVSYAFELAQELGLKTRDVVQSDKYKSYFPEIVLREDLNKKSHFANTRGGYRFAVGVDGQVTGRHSHFIVVDDPLDPQQAVSALELEKTNRFLRNTLPSRKVDKRVTPTLLVMQRLCVGDPTDLFLSRGRCRHVCLPAELTQHVKPKELASYYTDVGDGLPPLMDPHRLTRDVLAEAKNEGDFVYAGQYLQQPVPEGGGMFHVAQFRYRDTPPPDQLVEVVRGWDKASSATGDFSVGVKMGKTRDGRYVVMDVCRGRWDASKREAMIDRCAERDGFDCLVAVEQDPGAGGQESAESTKKRLTENGYRVRLLRVGKSEGDKVARADPFAVRVNNGDVDLVTADWNASYKSEFETFDGKHGHDDQVDASSTAFRALWRGKKRVGGARSQREKHNLAVRSVRRPLLGMARYTITV